MDALVTAFVAAFLAEWGGKTQLFAALLVARGGRPALVLAGIAVAALLGSLVAAFAGVMVGALITPRALTLLVALALGFAGIAALIGRKPPQVGAGWTIGTFLTALVGGVLLEFGDATQFLTFALAGRFDSVVLAAAGASAGIVAACAPAAMLGARLTHALPLRAIRIGAGLLFLLAAGIAAVNALRLA